MRSVRKPDSIGTLTRVSGTQVSLSASRVTMGAFQYVTVSTLTLDTSIIGAGGVDATLQPWKLYYIYAIVESSHLRLMASTSTSLSRVHKLIGYFDTSASSQIISVAKDLKGAVGDHKSAFLTEAQFQEENGPGWILADGRTVTGSRFATLFGSAVIPDLRGVVVRGKDNGKGNDAERALGNYQTDSFQTHGHAASSTITDPGHSHGFQSTPGADGLNRGAGTGAGTPSAAESTYVTGGRTTGITASTTVSAPNSGTTGTETRMKNVSANMFIKIN